MVNLAALSQLISTLETLGNSSEEIFGGYGQVWADGTIDRFVDFILFCESR